MAFQIRAKRFDLSFPVEFSADGIRLAGHCRNLSASGLLAVFPVELELWTKGDLLLHYGPDSYMLRSRVARVQGHEAGFSFVLQNTRDHDAIDRILTFALAHTHLVGAPPF